MTLVQKKSSLEAELKNERTIVCWTRMQAEAGQALERIVARKEEEWRLGGGVFFWGVGHPPAIATAQLARSAVPVPVIFSVMKSKPKAHDVAPERVVAWRSFIDSAGLAQPMPRHVLVTSRASSRSFHYALVCTSQEPLTLQDYGPFDHRVYRNVSAVGGLVGASQVTAILRRFDEEREGQYRVNLRAQLTRDYWVKLVDPVELPRECLALLDKSPPDILDLLSKIRTLPSDSVRSSGLDQQAALFRN